MYTYIYIYTRKYVISWPNPQLMQLDQLVEVDLQELPKASWRLYQGCLEHVAKPVSAF